MAMDEVKLIVLRFVFSILTFLVVSYLSSSGGISDLTSDLLATPEEKDQRRDAQLVLDRARRLFPQLDQQEGRSSHETIAAAALVLPSDESGMEHVGGHENIKRELLLHVVVPLKNAPTFFGNKALRPPTGILLSGPSGTGKTMLATALAHESGVPFLSIKPSMVEQKYYGESEKMVRAVFSLARKLAPCIVFIDEIDGMLKNRNDLDPSANYSIKTQMLQEMDALEKENSHVIVVGATNCPTKLDKALYRRLPRTYTVGVPDAAARKQILEKLVDGEPLRSVDESLVDDTEGFSGSDLKDMYKLASAFRNEAFAGNFLKSSVPRHVKPPPLTNDHWQAALERMYDAREIR